jgi:2-dehydro-3-deoxy-D-arabinonate dehydratase
MKLCRFITPNHQTRIGTLSDDGLVHDLNGTGIESIGQILNAASPADELRKALARTHTTFKISDIKFAAPVDRQEVWAAGVTYLRSKKARMEESDFSASAYDRVYDAPRPEIFFKSNPEKSVATGEPVGIRSDAKWNVPEPELALVMNRAGTIVGYTIGNDMSSRDIEGENLLYLPQAKTYHRSCGLGPWIVLGATEAEARAWTISIKINRNGATVFSSETGVDQIKRTFPELAGYLFRCQRFEHGAVLLTGTGIVPADDFTLAAGDSVAITISGIGTLENPVEVVD